MRTPRLYIGTSGWHYKHWIGPFYPSRIQQTEQLDYYQIFFNTVEINNSFYRMPTGEQFIRWRMDSADQTLFSVKASRYITHMKKLNDSREAVDRLVSNADNLKSKLGPILFQLPPGWNLNEERLEVFLKTLPDEQRYVFEFRNHTWYTNTIYDMLREHQCAFCIYDLAGHTSPLEVTADFVYVRLHGPGDKYQGRYSDEALRTWADRLTGWRLQGKDVYVYFDNDQNGYAVFNALSLKNLTESLIG